MRLIRAVLGWGLGGWLAAAGQAAAQVSVEVVMDQDQYLRDESLTVEVRITNRSGQDLRLGRTPDWLTFVIERREGGFVAPVAPPPVEGEFTLESSMVVKRRLDLMPYYRLGEPGRYTITAHVKIAAWDREISSKARTFGISRGTTIWEQRFGVPAREGVPEVRRYALIQAHDFKQLMLYVRLTDASDRKVFRVMALGQLVSFSRPEAQLDNQSHLHVLFQSGARAFGYCVMNPDGKVQVRQVYEYAETRPVLKPSTEGRVFVIGGVRRRTALDIPRAGSAPPAAGRARGTAPGPGP
ncbi:MAG: hypothetical protein JXQ71_13215 [Verrucomicrobia bacterium]|nr:hypothetical protein [Verrucomicrobiota bacterium]